MRGGVTQCGVHICVGVRMCKGGYEEKQIDEQNRSEKEGLTVWLALCSVGEDGETT